MEFTCLSEGKGFYFPPCHILDICGFRVLFDCPIDLSSLTIFAPVPIDSNVIFNDEDVSCSCENYAGMESTEKKRPKINEFIVNGLICAEPRYRTVKNLHLWDASFIDIVLISSPMGILGLPFLTRNKDFSAKVYVTEAAARIGQLTMEDLVNMHKEFRQFYGPEPDAPLWMKWDELELLPLELRQIIFGADGTDFGGWMPLYSAADVKACMLKVESLKYGEEVCYNGILIIKAFSSGLEIGSCNWSITGPKGSIAYVSSSVFTSLTAMSFNYKALQGSDVLLYSNFSSCNAPVHSDEDNSNFPVSSGNGISNLSTDDVNSEATSALLNTDEYLEEMDKLDFICSSSMDSIKAGGSVLIPSGRLEIILQLLERFALNLESENMKVPIFIVSSVAEELMAFTNIIPEWLCEQWQDRLYSGQPLFTHLEMLENRRLHLFPAIHSVELLKIWQEPCIVFCPHWSLRLGPVVHLLHRWSGDQNSLLVMEECMDASLTLAPFNSMAMKVLQCSFLSGMQFRKFHYLLKILQPGLVLFPQIFRPLTDALETSFSFSYFDKNKMICIPYAKEDSQLDIQSELSSQLQYTTLRQDIDVSRLKGELMVEHGRYRLSKEQGPSQTRPMLHFGRVHIDALLKELQKMGMDTTVEEVKGVGGTDNASLIHISKPGKAVIQVTEARTLISVADESVASLISRAVCAILSC